jgi:hypothetical protein
MILRGAWGHVRSRTMEDSNDTVSKIKRLLIRESKISHNMNYSVLLQCDQGLRRQLKEQICSESLPCPTVA